MELIISRQETRTVWCLFSVRTESGRPDRHDLFCWSREANGESRSASLLDMGFSLREDLAFFRAFAASSPDPAFLRELFEDR